MAQKDPGDTGCLRDLAVSDEGIGGVLQAQRDLAGALAMYRDSLAIFGALVQKDPGNTDWQLDLATSNDKFGDVLRMRGELPGALAAYRDGLAIARTLAQKDPENILWQRNLAYALSRIAGIEPEVGDAAGALGAEEERLAVRRHLYAVSPTPGAKSDLGDALGNLSFTLLLNRRPQDALDRAMEALALEPSALWIEANRAHALLFLGRFDDAKAIYLEDKDKALGSGKTFGDAVKDDFAEFRRNGIDTPELKTIEDLLAS